MQNILPERHFTVNVAFIVEISLACITQSIQFVNFCRQMFLIKFKSPSSVAYSTRTSLNEELNMVI